MSKSLITSHEIVLRGLKKRHAKSARLKRYGQVALVFACVMLFWLVSSLLSSGIKGFSRHEVTLTIDTSRVAAQLNHTPNEINFNAVLHTALHNSLPQIDKKDAVIRRQLYSVLGTFAGFDIKRQILAQPELWGREIIVTVALSDNADQYFKDTFKHITNQHERPLRDIQIGWLDTLKSQGLVERAFNDELFTSGDSRAPESAGVGGSMVGSILLVIVCMLCALPLGVMSAIYLEEYARAGWVSDVIEVTINNLAAVPSIIFGLLGLSLYLVWFNMPRSSALVGGLTLAFMVLPVIIITTRASLKAVPPSVRHGAIALGATPLQVVRHHVVPYALPGIMTGTILGVARALGETAPLLMIGMVAFVADIPRGFTDPATVLPVQIYLWASSPELGFVEKTASAILVLLFILLVLNALAVYIRNRFEIRW